MASLIPGYEYDIFISYRQKDNKYDGWVTEFVNNLKRELEATFKEEVTVYFDINPHDGLLETHDVDASLKEKLKCLVFIPIISRTYCDPKSFAWEHEFVAFIEKASKDNFGLKVKLPNGNVANRELPVRIHDLDVADIKLCESVLRGVLRGVEFIYKEPGVNKPLKSEDDEKKNLNKTKYRIQINKIANAIKEIISGLMAGEVVSGSEKTEPQLPWEEAKKEKRIFHGEKPAGINKSKLLSYSISALFVLLLIVVYVYPKFFKRDTIEKLRSSGEKISIAVMPFQIMTNDTTWNVWKEGIEMGLITWLSNTGELKVKPKESIKTLLQTNGLTEYASISPTIAATISKKLDADIYIYGGIQKAGKLIRLNAQVIDTKTKDVLKSFEINWTYNEEKIFDLTDSLRNNITGFLILSKLMKENFPANYKGTVTTTSPEAFRFNILGDKAFAKADYPTARAWYLKALAVDSNYFDPMLDLAYSYGNQGMRDQYLQWVIKIYNKKDQWPLLEHLTASQMYSIEFEPANETIKLMQQIQEIEGLPSYILGLAYNKTYQYDKAIIVFEKCLKIQRSWGKEFLKNSWAYPQLGDAYHKTGQYKKEKKVYKEAEKVNDDHESLFFSWIIYRQAVLSLTEKDTVTANKYIARYINICRQNSSSEAEIAAGLAQAYCDAGILDKSEGSFRKALSLEPENSYRMNRLAWFLIDKERNIDEGLALVDKALSLSPDKYTYFWLMDIRGWGLYKQGKYKESLELFEKIWEQRPQYDYDVYLHLEEARKAAGGQK